MISEQDIERLLIDCDGNIHTICRICLTKVCNDDMLANLREYIEIFQFCFDITFNEDDLLMTICKQCVKELTDAYEFKKKCNTAQEIFIKLRMKLSEIELKIKVEKQENNDLLKHDSNAMNSGHIGGIDDKFQIENQNLTEIKCENIEIIDYEQLPNYSPQLEEIFTNESDVNQCSVCRKILKSKTTLRKHMKKIHDKERRVKYGTVTGHGTSRRYHCSECPYSTPRSQTLLYHSRRHSGIKPHKCAHCSRRFTQPSTLNEHLKTHSDTKEHVCSQCGKQFKYKHCFVRHLKVHNETEKYACEICNKKLKSVDTLKSHMNRHYNIKDFSCEKCGATFVTHVELLSHSKQHDETKRYFCNLCDYKTSVKKNLEYHLIRHSGVRNFKCLECSRCFYTPSDLRMHMTKHTKQKNYCCPVCDVKFSRTTSLSRHMMKFHSVKYKNIKDRRTVR